MRVSGGPEACSAMPPGHRTLVFNGTEGMEEWRCGTRGVHNENVELSNHFYRLLSNSIKEETAILKILIFIREYSLDQLQD